VGIHSVLVVGAGIAGSTCAYQLGRSGMAVTLIERAGAQRSSGSPVDVRGPALAVVEQMSLLPAIRAAATQVTRLVAVDGCGRSIGWIPTQTGRGAVEIPRRDLCELLAGAASQFADVRYDDTVSALRDDGAGVEVTFERGGPCRFDLVVGADGLHSTVRRLVFGPEERFVAHLGLCIATALFDGPAADPHTVFIHNAPGRAVVTHPTTGREGAAFLFRHPAVTAAERSDPQQQQRLLDATFGGMGWRAEELLDRIRGRDDMYVDSVGRVRLSCWSRGRTVLVGDAAGCVSLLGEGSSMAIAGAATLARSLTLRPGDTAAALRGYEHRHRRRLRPHHLGAPAAGHLLVPQSRAGLAIRDRLFRAWAAAAGPRRRRA